METLVGFAFGFMVGTREGKQGMKKLKDSWAAIRESGDMKHLFAEATTAFGPVMRELARATGGGD